MIKEYVFNAVITNVRFDRFVKRVNQSIAQFVWHKKVAKIKQTTMIGAKENGGLDTPDFDAINSALNATWIKRINDSNGNANWSHIPTMFLRPLGGTFLLIKV